MLNKMNVYLILYAKCSYKKTCGINRDFVVFLEINLLLKTFIMKIKNETKTITSL